MRRKRGRQKLVLLAILALCGLSTGLLLVRMSPRERSVMDDLGNQQPVSAPGKAGVAVQQEAAGGGASPWQLSLRTAQRFLAWAIPGMDGWTAQEPGSMVVYQDGQGQGGLFGHYLPFLQARERLWSGVTDRTILQPEHGTQPEGGTAPGPVDPAKSTAPAPVGGAPVAAAVPVVGIYHTHDYESYISEFPGKTFSPEDEQLIASDDADHDILRVGRELFEGLGRNHVGVVWSAARHQQNGYLGAYAESRKTAQAMLKTYGTIKLLLDVHRDAGPAKIVKVGGKPVAQIDIVIGTGTKDLPEPHWQQNLAFAEQVKAVMDQMYPGLYAGEKVMVKENNDRYNQDLMPGAILFEIGSAQNSMTEALRGADLLANVLTRVIQEGKYPK